MNERTINDLAVKSGLAEDMGRGYKFPDNYLDFAELLIRECVGVVNANMDDILDQPVFNPTDEIWNRARVEELVRVALHIKKHFGVEE